MFSIGDVLVKVDIRARTTSDFNTTHHMMLIIDVTETGYPVVAHMKFINFVQYTGHLVIELCPTANDLRCEIASLARQACQSECLKIEKYFLYEENCKANLYRWGTSLEIPLKLDVLREETTQIRDLTDNMPRMISCHDFVLSVIHLASRKLSKTIPNGFNIPPRFAWSDILIASVMQDSTLSLSKIDKIIPPSESNGSNHSVRFFMPEVVVKKEKCTSMCLIL